jgi:O-antigen/teichoic acid export membrane protein
VTSPLAGRLARGGLLVVAIRVTGIALTLGGQVVLARVMGTDGFGAYAYLFSLLSLFVIPAKLGSDIAGVRFVSEYRVGEERHLLGPYVWWTLRSITVASAVAALAWVVVLSAGALRPDGVSTAAQLLAVAAVPLFAVVRFAEGALRGDERYVVAFAPFAVGLPALLIVAALGLDAASDGRPSVAAVLAAQLAAFAVVAAVQGVALSRLARSQGGRAGGPPPDRERRRGWLRSTVFLGLYSAFTLVLGQLDVVTVGALVDTRRAGQYAAAWRIASLVSGFLIALNLVLAPTVARLWVARDLERMQRILDVGVAGVVAASVAASGVIVVLREPLLRAFGDGFTPAAGVLVVLCAAQVVNAVGGPVGLLLNMTGHERDSTWVLGLTATLNLAVNIALVLRYGMIGAAWGTAACTVVWNVGLAWFVRRRLGLIPLAGVARRLSFRP